MARGAGRGPSGSVHGSRLFQSVVLHGHVSCTRSHPLSTQLTRSSFDQSDHWCKFDGTCHFHESEEAPRLWQRLETILSAWLELIERGKIVAVHHSVQDRRDDSPVEIDEATGARQEWSDEFPWTAVPFAKQDLVDSLDAWHGLQRSTANCRSQKRDLLVLKVFVARTLYKQRISARTALPANFSPTPGNHRSVCWALV